MPAHRGDHEGVLCLGILSWMACLTTGKSPTGDQIHSRGTEVGGKRLSVRPRRDGGEMGKGVQLQVLELCLHQFPNTTVLPTLDLVSFCYLQPKRP
jgi:hypothetical protein